MEKAECDGCKNWFHKHIPNKVFSSKKKSTGSARTVVRDMYCVVYLTYKAEPGDVCRSMRHTVAIDVLPIPLPRLSY